MFVVSVYDLFCPIVVVNIESQKRLAGSQQRQLGYGQ
jgi:hypothetical protein